MIDKAKGCLLGLAIGDTVGAGYEFLPPYQINKSKVDMIASGTHDLKKGQYTDDTSMALCLADSLLECNGTNLSDQADKYLKWYKEGYKSSTGYCFDIGIGTKEALKEYEQYGKETFNLPNDERQGNGCIMRLAPVAIFYYSKGLSDVLKNSSLSAITTHRNSDARSICVLFGEMLFDLFSRVEKSYFFKKYQISLKDKKELNAHGHMTKSLECALWAFYNTNTFEAGIKEVVALGCDTDTNAAIYGQLAGAYYGIKGIPKKWLNSLQDKNYIEQLAEKLFNN